MWKVPWYAVEDAVKGFAAGGAKSCHGVSRKRAIMCTPRCEECLIRLIAGRVGLPGWCAHTTAVVFQII